MDPLLALAFAMHSNDGVYALLLGSSVSRLAAIPTGWEVVLDLIKKLAAMKGEPTDKGLRAKGIRVVGYKVRRGGYTFRAAATART